MLMALQGKTWEKSEVNNFFIICEAPPHKKVGENYDIYFYSSSKFNLLFVLLVRVYHLSTISA